MRNRLMTLCGSAASVLVVCACGGSAPTSAGDVSAVREFVAQMRSDWVDAANRDDAATVTEMYADDAVMMGPDGVMRGRQAIQAGLAKGFAMTGGLNVTPATFDTSGDLAYDAGSYSQDMAMPDGRSMKMTGHYTVVLKRQPDGSWRIVQHISTPQPMPGA